MKILCPNYICITIKYIFDLIQASLMIVYYPYTNRKPTSVTTKATENGQFITKLAHRNLLGRFHIDYFIISIIFLFSLLEKKPYNAIRVEPRKINKSERLKIIFFNFVNFLQLKLK